MSKSFNVGQKSNPNYGNKNDNTKQMGNRSFYQNKNVPNQINPITPVNEPMPEMDIPKPSGKCRLFVANIINDISEEDFKNIFKDYGEATDVFVSNKGFGFIKLESKAMAEKAKCDLDGLILNNKILRVRISTSGTALKVLNLSQHATNETLLVAFSIFGPLDRAVVIADERGKSTGEAIVEFSRKNNCQMAMKKINEGVFLVTGSMRPVVVEPYETQDNDAGVSEKSVMKTPEYLKEMSQSPKFAPPGTFEYDYGNKWKALYQQEKIQRELLEKKIQEDREVLENDMENTLHEHQTMMLRQDLMRRQEELRRMEEGIAQFKKNKDGSGQNRDNFYQGNFNSYQQNYSQSNVPFPNQMNPMNMNQDMSQARPMFKPHEQFPIPVQDTVRQKDTENHQSNRSSTENQDQCNIASKYLIHKEKARRRQQLYRSKKRQEQSLIASISKLCSTENQDQCNIASTSLTHKEKARRRQQLCRSRKKQEQSLIASISKLCSTENQDQCNIASTSLTVVQTC